MLNRLKLKKANQGFTIIEVMIVLAIAGLILLVVFLAVPALQRGQRNNGRQAEASRYASAITNFVSNNNGSLPTASADVSSITSDFGSFKYLFSGTTPASGTAVKIAANTVSVTTQANYTPAALASGNDGMMIVTGAVCGSPNSSGVVTTAGTARQVALIYTLEGTAANDNQVCVQAE